MTVLAQPIALCLLVVITTAAVCDFRFRRVPNPLVGGGMAMALVLQCALHGPAQGAWVWLSGAAAGMALLLLPWLIRVMGAGDVKLLGAVGAFVGPGAVVSVWVASCLAGGVLAALLLLRRSEAARWLAATLRRNHRYATPSSPGVTSNATSESASGSASGSASTFASGLTPDADPEPESGMAARRARVPYAAAIAAGTLLAMYAGA